MAADAATAWATGREPMKVRCAIPGCEVKWLAVVGQQVRGWIREEGCPQARRADCAIEVK